MHGTMRTVGDVMTRTVVAVSGETPFKEIVRAMRERRVSALPVLAGEGRVIGVVSEADLLPKEEFRDAYPTRFEQMRRLEDIRKAGGVTARELMTAPALTVHPDTPLAEAARVMAVQRIKRLPVVDAQGLLLGIVSRVDLLKVFLRSDEEIAEEVRREVLGLLQPSLLLPGVEVGVKEGVVTLGGQVSDTSLIPLVARLVRGVEGVVSFACELTPAGKHTGPPGAHT